MAVVELTPRLFEQIRWVARWQKVSTDELASRAVSSYLDQLEWEKLQAELDAFQAQLPDLVMQFPDEYVAIHEGRVIDHDTDLRSLHSRVYAQMGSVPVLLQKVTETPAPEILVRSPRLEP
jgi:ferric iron reductase protein FhuF